MIDQKKFEALPEKVAGTLEVEKLPLKALLDLRERVHAALPARTLADLNLETETVVQYLSLKTLLTEVLTSEAPPNQKAQVANSVEAVLTRLMKIQLEMYGTERMKAMEQALIVCLRALPEEVATTFMEDYQRRYEAALGAKRNG